MSNHSSISIKALHIGTLGFLAFASNAALAQEVQVRSSKPSIIADIGGLASLRPVLSSANDDQSNAYLLKRLGEVERFFDSDLKRLSSNSDLVQAVDKLNHVSMQLPAMLEAFQRRFLAIALRLARTGELGLEPGELRFLEALNAEMNEPIFSFDSVKRKLASDAEAAALLAQLEAESFKLSRLLTRTVKGTEALRDAVESDPDIDKMTVRLNNLSSQLDDPIEILSRSFREVINKKENSTIKEHLQELRELPDTIKLKIDRRQQEGLATAIRHAYEHSFVGALCHPKQGNTSSDSVAKPHQALSRALDEMLKSIHMRNNVLAGQMERTTMIAGASRETLSARMKKIDASVSVTLDPELLAWIERKPPAQRSARITVSSGLIERLCKSVDPKDEVDALANQLGRLAARPAEISLRDYSNALAESVVTTSDEPDTGLLAIVITRKELAAALGAAFILTHELGHAIFDEWEIAAGTTAAERKMLAEVRADVFALLNADASGIFGSLKKECNVAIQTGRSCHSEGQQLSEVTAPYSFDEFLNLFLRTEFTEGDSEHPPIQQRFELLYHLYMAVFVEGKDIQGVLGQRNGTTK